MDISYSDGKIIKDAVINIWEDHHIEAVGYYRAHWGDKPDSQFGSPIIGYCSRGSHKTIRACAAEARRLSPGVKVYRNGREVK